MSAGQEEPAATDAEFEFRLRRNTLNGRRLDRAIHQLRGCKDRTQREKEHLEAGIKSTPPDARKRDLRIADTAYANARQHFFTAMGALVDPDAPGVDAEELGRRNFFSMSVGFGAKGGGANEAGIGWQDTEKSLAVKERQKKARDRAVSDVAIFGELTPRLTAEEILRSLPPDDVKKLFAMMFKDAVDDFKPGKAKLCMDVLNNFMKFVEPKILVDSGTDIDRMDEDEAKEFLSSAMRILQGGEEEDGPLPED